MYAIIEKMYISPKFSCMNILVLNIRSNNIRLANAKDAMIAISLVLSTALKPLTLLIPTYAIESKNSNWKKPIVWVLLRPMISAMIKNNPVVATIESSPRFFSVK